MVNFCVCWSQSEALICDSQTHFKSNEILIYIFTHFIYYSWSFIKDLRTCRVAVIVLGLKNHIKSFIRETKSSFSTIFSKKTKSPTKRECYEALRSHCLYNYQLILELYEETEQLKRRAAAQENKSQTNAEIIILRQNEDIKRLQHEIQTLKNEREDDVERITQEVTKRLTKTVIETKIKDV